MKALKKNAKNTQAIETQDLAQALADWYNNLACKVEFAVQKRDDQCPAIPTFKTPAAKEYLGETVWATTAQGSGHERLFDKNGVSNEKDCVAKFRYDLIYTGGTLNYHEINLKGDFNRFGIKNRK